MQPKQKNDHISHVQLPLVVFGPAIIKWFDFLAQRVNLHSKVTTTAARVLANQTLMASANLFVFLSIMAILEGDDPQKKLEKAFWPGMKATWTLWPAVDCQLHASATTVPSACNQRCEFGLELLSQLPEQQILDRAKNQALLAGRR